MLSNNRLQGTGTLKVGQSSKVLFRSAVLRKRSPVPEPGVSLFLAIPLPCSYDVLAKKREAGMNARKLVLALLGAVCIPVIAQTNQEFWGFYTPQNLETGSFVTACGGAGVAMIDEPGSVFINPANLPKDSSWGWALDAAALRNKGTENAYVLDAFIFREKEYALSEAKKYESTEIIPQFAGAWFSRGKWAFGAFTVWSDHYHLSYDLLPASMWVQFTKGPYYGLDVYGKVGFGNIDKHRTSVIASFSPNNNWRLALAAVWLQGNVHVLSISTAYPTVYWSGIQETVGSYNKLVPQLGVDYHSKGLTIGMSYRWAVSPSLHSHSGPTLQPYMFHKDSEEFLEPAVAHFGVSVPIKKLGLFFQYDYTWSGQQKGYVGIPPWYEQAIFRTDDDQTLRLGCTFPPIQSLHELQFQAGYTYVHHSGWYFPAEYSGNTWNDLLMLYYRYRFPEHRDFNIFTAGVSLPLSNKWSLRSGFLYSPLDRSLQVGVRYKS